MLGFDCQVFYCSLQTWPHDHTHPNSRVLNFTHSNLVTLPSTYHSHANYSSVNVLLTACSVMYGASQFSEHAEVAVCGGAVRCCGNNTNLVNYLRVDHSAEY